MPALPTGQTCLEHIGLTHRPVLLNKNEYQNLEGEIYNVDHPNAIADGDGRGRGTQHGGHSHSVPDCSIAEYIGEHYQSPIDPQIDTYHRSGPAGTGAGDCIDVHGLPGSISPSGRNRLLAINHYDQENMYGLDYVNTQRNVEDGQFVVGYNEKTPIVCPTA